MFQIFFDTVLAADSCSIDKHILSSVVLHHRIHGISGRSRNIRDDQTVFSEQAVDDGTLTHVGFSDNGDLRSGVLLLRSILCGKPLQDFIQQISDPGPVRSGYRVRIPDPQIVKLIDRSLVPGKAVHLIDNQQNRLMAAPEHVCDLGIRIHKSLFEIRHEEDHIRGIDGDLRLFSHLREDNVICIRLNTAGVNHGEAAVQPFHICIDAVSGDTRGILYDRYS